MDGSMVGIIGAVVGCTVGIAGGIFGTWRSVRAARSEAERRYVLRWAIGCSAGIAAFLVLLAWLPQLYQSLAFVPYVLVLGWAIRKSGIDLSRLRATGERHSAQPGATADRPCE